MPPATPQPYGAEIEVWREERYARLREPMSWLTLVALEWLREGENRMGMAQDADARLPSGPPIAGHLRRTGRRVTAHAGPGAGLTHGGGDVEGLELVSDMDAPEGEDPTFLELGALRMCLIRRGENLALRVWDTDSPLRRDFAGIPHYPVDRAWRLEARFERAAPGETFAVPDVMGEVIDEPLAGTVVLSLAGATHRIKALDGGDGSTCGSCSATRRTATRRTGAGASCTPIDRRGTGPWSWTLIAPTTRRAPSRRSPPARCRPRRTSFRFGSRRGRRCSPTSAITSRDAGRR